MTMHAVVRFVGNFVKLWDVRRGRCFARLVYALMHSRRLGVAEIGRRIPTPTSDKHHIKSVDRFLGNPKVELDRLWTQLMALASCASKRLYVFIDWTDLHHHGFEVLQAAVSFGGRSLPIAWTTARKGEYSRSRNRIETTFCLLLKRLAPADVELVLIADRGFARASLMRALQKAHIPFIIRVRKDVHLIHGRGEGPLRSRVIARGQIRDFEGALYGDNARFPGRCIITRGFDAKEPWYLLTNLPSERWQATRVIQTYAKRMRIEETFRDHKSMRFGFQLRSVKLSTTERYDRLLAIAAVALLLLINLGAYVEDRGLAAGFKANTAPGRTHSLFQLGLAFLPRLGLRRPPRRLLAWVFNTET
jgi:hypothetical protein